MSSILKALKKLEDEKALRQADSLRIDAEILRTAERPRLSPLKLGLIAMFLFGCGGAVTYLHLKGVPVEPAVSPPAPNRKGAGNSDRSAQTVPVERIQPDPVIVPAGTVTGAAEISHIPGSRDTGKRTAQAKPVRAEQAPAEKGAPSSAGPRPLTVKPPVEIRSAMTGQVPALKVNGIAFQDGIDSVAMINNVPVSRGSLIEGVRVENIYRDRVQFMFGTEKFEIPLGRSNR
ncbi:hypothetical protein [Geobacter sp. SVR]|uniref:hypothetical protein n=1 Tax=Geobacter sp. SVR TaxID=2495594 RepID=UPI00143EFCF0|nr:hypothetical protein [Geobacter sp. SVR]BCS53860.1 hypothetical protein GSVR_21680 [Geobacter sp. SVR]GCF85631.1 hypothetical protein GSbR_22310 [Geobacter sp. SVR]